MEGKTSVVGSSSASKSTKNGSGNMGSSSGLFTSVFPPASTILGRDASNSDIFGPSRQQGSDGCLNSVSQDKADKLVSKNSRRSIEEKLKIDPCHLSSSLYYGGQDVYKSTDDHACQQKKDVHHNSGSYRGDLWEGSLYY